MRLKLALAAFAVLLVASSAIAQTTETDLNTTGQIESTTVNLTQLQNQYNQRSDEIPGFVGSVIGDQTITINLSELETGSEMLEEDIIGVKTNCVKTEDIQWGAFEEPSLKIWITQENVESINNAEDTAQKINQMMKNDEIRYETYTLGNALKFGLMELAMGFM